EHVDLADSVQRFTDRHITAEVLRTEIDLDTESMPPFWPDFAEQGLLGLHIPEQYGGQGAGLLELAVAIEALGRAAQPGPALSTMLASAVLVAADAQCGAELLPGLADGSTCAAVGLSTPLQAEHAAAGVTVHGQTDAVLG